MASNSYASTSSYFSTPVINGQYLGVMVNRSIPKLIDDLSMTLNETYNLRPDLLAYDLYSNPRLWWVFAQRNPDSIEDPVYDFAPGVKIRLPKLSNLKSDLGI